MSSSPSRTFCLTYKHQVSMKSLPHYLSPLPSVSPLFHLLILPPVTSSLFPVFLPQLFYPLYAAHIERKENEITGIRINFHCTIFSDLVFCTNSEGIPVVLPQEFHDLSPSSLKHPLGRPGELRWNAVIVAGRNSFIRNTEELRGTVHMRKRQLRTLGYYVSVVSV